MLLYVYEFSHMGRSVYFYAECEENARRDFKEAFGVTAGDLISRENW